MFCKSTPTPTNKHVVQWDPDITMGKGKMSTEATPKFTKNPFTLLFSF